MAGNLTVCDLCNEKESRYCCSRCYLNYCSVECFKCEKHLECSEQFYRLNLEDYIRRPQVNFREKMSAKEVQEFETELFGERGAAVDYSLDSDDESSIEPLDERMTNINLDDSEKVWNALTIDEKNEFEAIVESDRVQSLVQEWQPWWLYHKKVEELEKVADYKEEEALKRCPPIIEVPKLKDLTSIEPAPTVKYDIVNAMCAYAFVMRYFNGDVEVVEATNVILDICESLDTNTNFSSPALATKAAERRCKMSKYMEANKSSLNAMGCDSFRLLQGPSATRNRYYCLAALSHMHQLFTEGIKASKSPKRGTTKSTKKSSSTSPKKTPTKSSQNDKKSVCSEENNDTVSECLHEKESIAKSPEDQTSATDNSESEKENNFFKRFPQSKLTLEVDIKKVKKSIKKIEYYIAFLNKCEEDELENLPKNI